MTDLNRREFLFGAGKAILGAGAIATSPMTIAKIASAGVLINDDNSTNCEAPYFSYLDNLKWNINNWWNDINGKGITTAHSLGKITRATLNDYAPKLGHDIFSPNPALSTLYENKGEIKALPEKMPEPTYWSNWNGSEGDQCPPINHSYQCPMEK